ncbi:multidrug resistance protein SMR [Pontibacillus halophilus JSM 076056 = DSM 19796]|uniref:Multidrug resistance protein SMR n=1 Tax=Pontibacillus halophilus JSM 076056 = DSM 19796 TaxID=1385510 RepID=A0A0A5GG14_9BACI|nr:multidrug efflux SMR transporter [Pontibacillus halophilus]KGX90944.1 multidrug resistance protein SMR [Pontibacillus halophilus JSM 076056 = DSM 19796]
MAWVYLLVAGIFEMSGVTLMNKWHQEKKKYVLGLIALGFAGSFGFLSLAMNTLSMGTAYAIWTGIGAAGGALLGMVLYNESKERKRIAFILVIIGATIGLKLV